MKRVIACRGIVLLISMCVSSGLPLELGCDDDHCTLNPQYKKSAALLQISQEHTAARPDGAMALQTKAAADSFELRGMSAGTEIVEQKNFPIIALDLLECFSQVTAKHTKHSKFLEYFLFMGSDLAAARGGEVIPYDHDMDVAIDPAYQQHFTKIWRHPQAIAAYMEEFPSCSRASIRAMLACPEGNNTFTYFTCTNAGCSNFPRGGMVEQVNSGCWLHQLQSAAEGGSTLDVWKVPILNSSKSDQVCHWGFCMNLQDVLPTKPCTLRSTPLGREVSTRCMQNAIAWAKFYSINDSAEFFRSSLWEQPKYNFWNGSRWQWCENAWDDYKSGVGDLYVYGDAARTDHRARC